jgi:hypothetical protein
MLILYMVAKPVEAQYPIVKPNRVSYQAKYVMNATPIKNGSVITLLPGRGANLTTVIEEIIFIMDPGTVFTVGAGTDTTILYTTYQGKRKNMFNLEDEFFTDIKNDDPIIKKYTGGIDKNAAIKIDFADKLQGGSCELTILINYKIDETGNTNNTVSTTDNNYIEDLTDPNNSKADYDSVNTLITAAIDTTHQYDSINISGDLVLSYLESPTRYGWLYLDSASNTIGVDSIAIASFGLTMPLPDIKKLLKDTVNGEIPFFWQDERGYIHKRYGVGGTPLQVIEQLTAATEFQYRYILQLQEDLKLYILISAVFFIFIVIFIILKK